MRLDVFIDSKEGVAVYYSLSVMLNSLENDPWM